MDTTRRCLCGWTITLAALTVTGSLFAQPGPPQRQGFEERIKAIASSFKSIPSLKRLSQAQLENLLDFMVGNMLFVLNHEMAHVIINDFHIPVLGDEEDAADDFAIVTSLRFGTDFSYRVLGEALLLGMLLNEDAMALIRSSNPWRCSGPGCAKSDPVRVSAASVMVQPRAQRRIVSMDPPQRVPQGYS